MTEWFAGRAGVEELDDVADVCGHVGRVEDEDVAAVSADSDVLFFFSHW